MKRLKDEIVQFLQDQGCIIVSTIDRTGGIHTSCKGILKINQSGKVYLLDLYQGTTLDNLRRNSHISLTAIDEHKFCGYCLKGKAKIIRKEKLISKLIKLWDERITGRISRRIIRNIQGVRGHPTHPEVLLPQPEYLIVVEVDDIIDLTPQHLKESGERKKTATPGGSNG